MHILRTSLRQAILTPRIRRYSSSSTTTTTKPPSDPLRILFCGSDEFSAASLSALVREQSANPSLIRSIDVLVRPPKPTGRGYKALRPVPLQSVAAELSLPLHAVNTFTGWTPPPPAYDLVVAVSFGLFVPRRILRAARYGGLNVHPSLLPDLRGPAPIHRALLDAARTHTGVSLQTLSEEGFDSGEVLAQTPLPGIEIPRDADVEALRDVLVREGAEMLVDGLRRGVHVPPRRDVGWKPTEEERERIAHAPKITKADSEVRWREWMPDDMVRRARVLGDALWSRAVARDGKTKRVIFRGVQEVPKELRPEVVRRYLDGGREERKAMKDDGLVRFVVWKASEVEARRGADTEEATPRFSLVPYFVDPEVEGAVVIPFAGGGCVRTCEAKLEGSHSEPAASGLRRVSYTAEELRNLKDDARFGGHESTKAGDTFADSFGLGITGLLDGLLD